jgi:hypothetical protein
VGDDFAHLKGAAVSMFKTETLESRIDSISIKLVLNLETALLAVQVSRAADAEDERYQETCSLLRSPRVVLRWAADLDVC